MASAIKGVEGVQGKLQAMSSRLKSIGSGFMNVGKVLTVGVTAPLLALGVSSARVAAQFEQRMSVLRQASGASAGEMQQLSKYAKQMGAETTFSANEAADAMVVLAKAGLTPAQIKGGALAASMRLAATEGLSLATSGEVVANAMGMFGLKATDAARISDAFAGGATASTASVSSLTQALQQVGPSARNFGLDLNDTVGVLAMFDQMGLKGSDAGTSLKTMLSRLVPQTEKQAKAMEQMGLSFTNADGSMKPIEDIAQQLQDRFKGMSQEQRNAALQTIFGSDAVRAATILMNQGAAGVNKYVNATKERGAAQKMADARMKGTAGAIESLKGSWETLQLTLGEALLPTIANIARSMVGVLNGFAKAFESIGPRGRTFILVLAGIAAAAGPVLVAIGAIISAVGHIVGVFSAIAGAGGLGAALAPILPVLAPIGIALAALAAAGVLLWANWKKVTAFFKTSVMPALSDFGGWVAEVAAAVAPSFQSVIASVKQVLQVVGTLALTIFGGLIDAIRTAAPVIGPFLKELFVVIGTMLAGAAQAVAGLAQAFLALLRLDWAGVSAGLTKFGLGIAKFLGLDKALRGLAPLWNTFTTNLKTSSSQLATTLGSAWNRIKTNAVTSWNLLVANLRGIWNRLRVAAITVFNYLAAPIRAAWARVRAVTTAAWAAISAVLRVAWNIISSIVRSGASRAVALLRSGFGLMRGIVQGVMNAIRAVVRVAMLIMNGNWREAWRTIVNTARAVFNTGVSILRTVARNIMNSILGAWRSFGARIRDTGRAVLTNFVGGIKDRVGRAISSVKTFIGRIINAVKRVLKMPSGDGPGVGKGNIIQEMTGDAIGQLVKNKIKSMDIISSAVSLMGGGSNKGLTAHTRKMLGVASSQFGLRLTSGFRPGSITASGRRSLHASGRAIDVVGSRAQKWAAFNYFRQNAGAFRLYEMINEHSIYKPGRGTYHWARNDHMDHLHIGFAMAKGGIVTRPTVALVGEAGPEAVIPLGGGGSSRSSSVPYGDVFITVNAEVSQNYDVERLAETLHRYLQTRARAAGAY